MFQQLNQQHIHSNIISKAFVLEPSPFIESIAKFFPKEMEILQKLGIYPSSFPFDYSPNNRFFNPWEKKEVQDNFSNIGSHIIAVHLNALMYADAYLKAGLIDMEGLYQIGSRALMHDASKVYNLYLDRAKKSGLISDAEYNSPNVYDEAINDMHNKGISKELAVKLFYDYGSETGGSAESIIKFIKINERLAPELLKENYIEKIVHVADDSTASLPANHGEPCVSFILTVEERLFVSGAHIKAPWGWIEGLGIDSKGNFIKVPNVFDMDPTISHCLSLHAYMIWLTTAINEEHCAMFHNGEKGSLANQLVKESISNKLSKLTPDRYSLLLSGN